MIRKKDWGLCSSYSAHSSWLHLDSSAIWATWPLRAFECFTHSDVSIDSVGATSFISALHKTMHGSVQLTNEYILVHNSTYERVPLVSHSSSAIGLSSHHRSHYYCTKSMSQLSSHCFVRFASIPHIVFHHSYFLAWTLIGVQIYGGYTSLFSMYCLCFEIYFSFQVFKRSKFVTIDFP